MFRFIVFVLCAFALSSAQGVSDVVVSSVGDVQNQFMFVIGSIVPVILFVVVAIVGVCLAIKLFRKVVGDDMRDQWLEDHGLERKGGKIVERPRYTGNPFDFKKK